MTGWLPAVLTIIGGLILLALILWPAQWSWWWRVVLLAVFTAVLILAGNLLITKVWRPFPDQLPTDVLVWAGLGLFGLVLGIAHFFVPVRLVCKFAAALAGLAIFITIAGTQINRFYGQYPTLGTALGLTRPELTDLSTVGQAQLLVSVPEGAYVSDVWRPTEPLPPKGTISRVDIPPSASGFTARPGYVYLPPAYALKNPRPLLPVLVLLAGQPGNADSGLISGQLAKMMDRYAASHQGLAPIVVMADNLGANFANPLCVDSKHGNAATYLSVDVPTWITGNLQTAGGAKHWAIGGLSNGGTCALQMATRAPEVYGRFLDISGEYEPVDSSKEQTIGKYFDGNADAYKEVSPIEVMKTRRFHGTAGRIVVGKDDQTYNAQLREVLKICEAAGMEMTFLELPGGHTWQVWVPGLEQSLGWLASRTGLAPE